MDIICQEFGITRQAYYQKRRREARQQESNMLILEMVRQVRRKHPRMGARKLLVKIQPMVGAEGLGIGRDRLFDLLRAADLLVKRRKTYFRTTIPGLCRMPNLLPGLTIDLPNQVWVCDITYLELERESFVYLFLLMDLFSRYIVGWHVASSLATTGALISLQMAIQTIRGSWAGLIHHSDHGTQYTSKPYLDTLLNYHLQPSMGAVGNCYDNIFAERVIGTLKGEYALNSQFANRTQAFQAAQEAVYLYNCERPHLALNMAVPSSVYLGHVREVTKVKIPHVPTIRSTR